MGFETVGVFSSNGSTIIVKPFVYVDTNVAKCVINIKALKSVISAISNVRNKDANRWAQNRNGLRSIQIFDCISRKKPTGVSCTTCWTRKRVFIYSINRFKNPTKCSALRIFPGTASAN